MQHWPVAVLGGPHIDITQAVVPCEIAFQAFLACACPACVLTLFDGDDSPDLRMLKVSGGILVAVVLCSAARAATDDPKALFETATVQFRLGKFHEAAETYAHVYELHHDPVLLYNCAQSYRLANEPEKALLFYKSFLASQPNASNRDEVEGRIAELERVVAAQKKANERPPNEIVTPPAQSAPRASAPIAAPTSTPATTASEVSDRGRSKKIVGIALLGGALAAAVGGAVAAVFSGKASDTINAAAKAGEPFDPSQESAGRTDTVVSGVMFGLAGAAAVAGGVVLGLGIRDGRSHEARVSFSPALSPSVVGGATTVRF